MWAVFRFGLLCALLTWCLLFVSNPRNLSDLAQRVGQILPKPQQVAAAVSGAAQSARPGTGNAPPAAVGEPQAPEPAREPAGKTNRIRVH